MKKRKNRTLVLLCCTLAVPTCAVLTGEAVMPSDQLAAFEVLRPWLLTGALLGIAHLLLRPILRLLSAPLGCLTLGLFGLVIDVGLIYACGALVEGVRFGSLLFPLLTAILINIICAVTGNR